MPKQRSDDWLPKAAAIMCTVEDLRGLLPRLDHALEGIRNDALLKDVRRIAGQNADRLRVLFKDRSSASAPRVRDGHQPWSGLAGYRPVRPPVRRSTHAFESAGKVLDRMLASHGGPIEA